MSYYQVYHFDGVITKELTDANITNYVGNDVECCLNIPDDKFLYHVNILMSKFDVAFMERSGKTFIMLDTKFKHFSPR
jgi:hypothetical protein